MGGIEPDQVHQEYVDELKKKYRGLPVEWRHDIPDTELKKLYADSSIFWHAAGIDINELERPQQVEHFGMSTVEAMSYGLIPLVVEKGGLKEIITDNHNGFFFDNQTDLMAHTQNVITLSDGQIAQLRQRAYQRAQDFSLDRFCRTLDDMLGNS